MNKHKLLKHSILPLSKLLSISLFALLLHITGTNAFSLLLMTAFFAALHLRAQMASLVVTLLALQSCISFPFLKVFPVYGVLLWVWILLLGALIFYVKAPLFISKNRLPRFLKDTFGRYWRCFLCLVCCFLVLTVLFRNFNPYRMTFYALASFYVAEILRQYGTATTRRPPFSLRKYAINGCLLALSSVLTLGLCEVIARQFFTVKTPQGRYLPHEKCIYITKPNTLFRNYVKISPTEATPIFFEVSEQGLRNRVLHKKNLTNFGSRYWAIHIPWGGQ